MNVIDIVEGFAGLSKANRPIRARLSKEQRVPEDVLLVKRVTGSETMCDGLEHRLLCVSTRADLPLKEFIALPVELQFVTDQGYLRAVCGIVAQAGAGQSDGGLATYELVMRDALALMAYHTNTRVFRNLNELDITQVILDEWRRNNPVLAKAIEVDWSYVKGTTLHGNSRCSTTSRMPISCAACGNGAVSHGSCGPGKRASRKARTYRPMRWCCSTTHPHCRKMRPARSLPPRRWYRAKRHHLCVESGAHAQTWQPVRSQSRRLFDDVPHAGEDGNDYQDLGELRMKRHRSHRSKRDVEQ